MLLNDALFVSQEERKQSLYLAGRRVIPDCLYDTPWAVRSEIVTASEREVHRLERGKAYWFRVRTGRGSKTVPLSNRARA